MVIINKREESKLKTRELILQKTKELIMDKGIINLTTAIIAKECNIAHGSLFQHFGNKDNLINTVLDYEIKRLAEKIKNNCNAVDDLEGLLGIYIQVISEEEKFLSVIYMELPFMTEDIKRNMVSLEAILRNIFFLKLDGKRDRKHITIKLDAFFSTVIRYLSLKELYSPEGDVIRAKSDDIKKLFYILFKEECKNGS